MNERERQGEDQVYAWEISERLERKIEKRTLMIRITGIVIGLAVLLGISFLLLKLFVTVKEIRIEGANSYAAPDIIEASGIEKGTILPFVSKKSAKNSIISRFPMIMDVEVSKEFPDSIVLKIIEEKPQFYFEIYDFIVYGDKKTVYAVVAQSGKIIAIYESKNEFSASEYASLPRIVMPKIRYAVAGERIVYAEEGDGKCLTELLSAIEKMPFAEQLLWVDISSRFDMAVYLGEKPDKVKYEIRLGNRKSITDKLMLAESIMDGHLDEAFSWMINVEEITGGFARKIQNQSE